MRSKKSWSGIVNEYRQYLPVTDNTRVVTLNEGGTPLIRADRLSEELELDLYLKFEGANPTGSFKDRGMAMAMTRAVADGAQAVICASTGNTSAAAAAYAARAGLNCFVLIPEGKIALGKLAQALIYGAKVISLDGNFDQALRIVRSISAQHPITLVNSVNPFRIEGQKTAAFEICDQLGKAPDFLAIPVGNAGNITAYWKGFREYHEHRQVTTRPRLLGFQAAGAAPIVTGKVVPNPETVATAIRIGNPASWQGAVAALQESGGTIQAVTDEEILDAYQELARSEGVFAEPASAASLAGVIKLARTGYFAAGAAVVCVLTGHGLKDPDNAIKTATVQPTMLPADENAVLKAIL